MKKRLLAMLLVLMLVVGLLPVGVLAAPNDTEFHIIGISTMKDFVRQALNVDDGEKITIHSVEVYGLKKNNPDKGTPEFADGGVVDHGYLNKGDVGARGTNGKLTGFDDIWTVLNSGGASGGDVIDEESITHIVIYSKTGTGPLGYGGEALEPVTLYLSDGSIKYEQIGGKLVTEIYLDEASLEPPEEVEYSYTINYYFVDSDGNETKSSTVDTVTAEAISNSTIQYKAANELEGYQTDVTYVLDTAKSSDSFVWTADKQVFEVYYAVDGNNNETPDYEEEPDEKTYTLKYVASSDNLNESLVWFDTPVPSQQQGISTTGSYTFTVADSAVETAKGGINYTYGFLGWSTEPLGDSAEDVDYNPGEEITVSEDTTLYGVWERLFLVRYSTGDVDYFTTEEYYCSLGSDTPDFQQEAVVNVTTAYDKDNDQYYVFTGWSPAVTDTVTNSVEYKAQWRTKQFAVQFKIDPDDKGGELSSDGFDVDYEDEYWKHVNYKTEIRVGVDSEPISDQEGYKYFYNGWTAETADGDDITTTNIKESSANEVLFVMPAEDAVVTIHYELKADFNNNNVPDEEEYLSIHVSFVGPNGEAYGGGDVISTMPDVSVEIADPVAEGKTFVGWKKLVGLEEIYTGEFTYTALAALVGDNFTPDTHETWLEFEAVFEDEIIEPDPYNTIHVSFVGPNGEAYGGGDVISTMPDVSVEIADPVAEGKTFVGWKKLVGLEEIYNGEFTYTALAALVGDNFTPDTHEAWLTFEAVFEDETVEPDPYYIINIRFVDSDGTTSLGGGDVISTSPDTAYPSVPSPVAPQGMEFVGWKVWLGNEPMYEGKFTYNALKALREELDGEITWVDGRTWITFQAVYEDVTVEPDPDITDFSKTLLTDRDAYNFFDIAYPEFYHGDVVVDEGEGVTLIYRIVVEGTPGTAYTISDPGARLISNGSWTGTIDADGRVSILVAKTFSWRDVRNAGDTLDNTASVSVDGETVKTDTERVPVDIDWDINVPDIDDDDDDDVAEPDDEYIPNWLNTTDHYSYIVGYEDGTIRPGNNITRAEVATIFYRLLSEGSSERWYSASNSFSDVAADSWYNVPVSTLSNMGIIDGYEDGTFKPNAPITRAEFTAIATRFFDYTAEYEGAFNDVTYSDWYADCVQAAVDMGLVNGYADGGFHPNAYITRAESCAIVNRVLNRVPHEDYLLDEDEMITWPDNRYGAWYYADMQEATNSHDYDWISVSGEVVEEWTDKLAEPNW